ncbi:MAG: glycosyltransferase family 4 protein [Planctomycetota bacterium]|nr:glycosyltransferase family 4 protein [Planctomycetota bacterium]
MRIALTHTRLARRGGIEGYLYRLAGSLLERGEEVHYFAATGEPLDHPRFFFHRVRALPGPPFLKVWCFDRSVQQALREGDFDVVHGFTKTSRQDVYTDGSGCQADFEQISLPLRGPVRRAIRRWGPHRYAVARLEALRYRRGRFRRVIAMSKMASEQIRRRHGLSESEVEVLYNGVDLDEFSPGRRETEGVEMRRRFAPDDVLLVLFVGNDGSRKGADILLNGMQRIGPVRAKALIAGRVSSERDLLSLARSLGVEVELLGPREDISCLLAAADLLVFPSRFDIFGMSVLEAMASGIPVVVSRSAGASEIVTHGKDGWVIGTEDCGGVAEGIRRLADPVLRRSMGKEARRTAEGYSIDRHTDRLIEIYREVAEEKRRATSLRSRSLESTTSRLSRN